MHRLYGNDDITIFWDSDRCRHAKKCVTNCPEVFDITRKPWIKPENAATAKIWQTISLCPTGALSCVYNHDIKVVFEEENFWSAAYDGDVLIGECDYTVNDGKWAIVHTEVVPEHGGKGIAKRLVFTVVEEAEKKGTGIIPVCSYAAKILG
ncbi:MAG: GNAT family N-acetyltransferase [Lachnospiraceae bacterium]|nr:GNAT family N-acetyltransferase [Lachnospiraceae bacterium]